MDSSLVPSTSLPTWLPDASDWSFAQDAATVRGNGEEWTSLFCEPLRQRNVLVSVRIAGTAGAAGISFGAFTDFIAPVDAGTGERLLQFDVDGSGWVFRVDGVRMERVRWDGAVKSVDDLFDGPLSPKARHAEEVTFRSPSVTPYEECPRVKRDHDLLPVCAAPARRTHELVPATRAVWCARDHRHEPRQSRRHARTAGVETPPQLHGIDYTGVLGVKPEVAP